MTRRKGEMTKTGVKTWRDLEAFAVQRAAVSIKRNDPIAWSYWEDTRRWAIDNQNGALADPGNWQNWVAHFVGVAAKFRKQDPREAARSYSRAKWLRILSLNSGLGHVKPLSLAWLKTA